MLLCGRNVLMLSFVCAVEPVDGWRPEANLYEPGEIAGPSLRTVTLPVKPSVQMVSINQTKKKKPFEEKASWFLLSR